MLTMDLQGGGVRRERFPLAQVAEFLDLLHWLDDDELAEIEAEMQRRLLLKLAGTRTPAGDRLN